MSQTDRLQRMLQRQQDREKILKEKEDKRLEKEKEMNMAREKQLKEQNAELYENEKIFKKSDNHFGGVVGGLPSFNFRAVNNDRKVPEQFETEEKGPLAGNVWKRTPVGWMRMETKDVGYKQPCTADCLPMWLYEELDIIFGMRRLSSIDFYYSSVILDRLFHQYMSKEATSTLVKKRIMLDIKLAIARIKKNPECVKREERVLSEVVVIMANLEQQINQHYFKLVGVDTDDTNNNDDAKSSTNFPNPNNEENICERLPEEVMLQIFSNLYKPRDLCCAASVCVYWSTLANDNMLFSHFITTLCASLSIEPPESPLPKKELFIQLWTNRILPSTGIAKCSLCGEFFWMFKKSFCRNTYGGHSGKVFDVTKIIPLLVDRVHHY